MLSPDGGDKTNFETLINVTINLKHTEVVTNVTEFIPDTYKNKVEPYFTNLENSGKIKFDLESDV